MSNKIVLLGLAVVAVGMFALPQTMALFAGQHNFYDTITSGSSGNAIPCEKCHADIAEELSQPGAVNSAHLGQDCFGCHMSTAPTNEGLTWTKNAGTNPERAAADFHAAALVACLDCHGAAGPGNDARSIFNGSAEAHKPFVNSASADDPANKTNLLKGANEACIGCHTHVAVDINWQHRYMLVMNATVNDNHVWTVDNFAAAGTADIETYGNQTGDTTGTTAPPTIGGVNPPGFDAANP